MKYLSDISDVKKLQKQIADAEYFVDTATEGSINFVVINAAEGPVIVDGWTSEADETKNHVRIQAFGSNDNGDLVLSNLPQNDRVVLLGKGKKNFGKALFVQRLEDVFTIIYHRDDECIQSCFRMSSTKDPILVNIILLIVQDSFCEADVQKIHSALARIILAPEVVS